MDPLIPAIVAIIGIAQVVINIWAGRRQSKATAIRDEATATKEMGESWKLLVDVLEDRIEKLDTKMLALQLLNQELEEKNGILEEEMAELKRHCREVLMTKEKLEKRIRDLEKGVENGNSVTLG